MKKRIKRIVLIGGISIPIALGFGVAAQANIFETIGNSAIDQATEWSFGFFEGAFQAVTGFESPQAFAEDIFSDIMGKQDIDLAAAENIEEHLGDLGSVDFESASAASQDSLKDKVVNRTGINVNMASKDQEQALERNSVSASAKNTLSKDAQAAARESIEQTGKTNAQHTKALSDVMDFTVTQDIAKYQAALGQSQNQILGDIKAAQIAAAQRDAQANKLLSNIDGSLHELVNQGGNSGNATAVMKAAKSRLNNL